MKLMTQTQGTEKVISIYDLGKKQVHWSWTQCWAHRGLWPACLCLCRGERQVLFSLLIHFLSHSSCAIAIENCNTVWEALGFWVLPPDWAGECCCSGIMCEHHLLRGAAVGSAGEAPSAGTRARGARLPSLLLTQTFPCRWISFLFPCGTFFVLCPKAELFLLWVLEVFFLYFFPCVGFLLGFSMHTKPGSKSGSSAAVYCSTRVNVECLSCFEKLLPKIWPPCKKVSRERLWNFGADFLLAGGVCFFRNECESFAVYSCLLAMPGIKDWGLSLNFFNEQSWNNDCLFLFV